MHKMFQPTISADFLKMVEDSFVGKALIERTGMSVFKMLSRFTLYLPIVSNPTSWLVESDVSFAHHLPDIILFLKYAWLYSEREENEHIDRLRKSVSEEITSFEKDLLFESKQRKLDESTKLLRSREEEVRIVQKELTESQLLLKASKSKIKQQKKNLNQTQTELKIKLQKEKEISIRNSNSASKPRGCPEINEYLEKLVVSIDTRPIEIWFLIPGERDGSDIYREYDKIYHEGCACRPFGKQAFYKRIQKIKENLERILPSGVK